MSGPVKLISAETQRTDEMRNAGLMAKDGAAGKHKQPPSIFLRPALPGYPDVGVSVLANEVEGTERIRTGGPGSEGNGAGRANIVEAPSRLRVGPVSCSGIEPPRDPESTSDSRILRMTPHPCFQQSGELLQADGSPLRGPNGELLGHDGGPLHGPASQPFRIKLPSLFFNPAAA